MEPATVGHENRAQVSYEFAESVPTTRIENLRWREEVIQKCDEDEGYQEVILDICRQDSLFWLSTFCWLYEPRPTPHVLPFIPWPHQLPAWKQIERCMGYCDVGLEKSRGEGASWMIVMLVLHKFLFVPMFAAGLVSKDERSVDDPENPDSLFWKITWQLEKMPTWMQPDISRSKTNHTLVNKGTGATIAGFAATGDVASGGRKTVFVMDELAKFPRGPDKEAMDSTQHVTNSRIIISTPKGAEGAYFEAMHADANMEKVILDWTTNPTRNIGMYRVCIESDNTRTLDLCDREYWLEQLRQNGKPWAEDRTIDDMAKEVDPEGDDNPFGYDFMIDTPYTKHNKARSPWYDRECRRVGATPAGIAQELDRDYGGSSSRFFDSNMLHRVSERCTPPRSHCSIAIPTNVQSHLELRKCQVTLQSSGRIETWFEPDIYKRPPGNHVYFVGVDVAIGGGGVATSNSTIEAVDATTCKQALQFACPNTSPYELAELAVAICYWLSHSNGPANLIWEGNGVGQQFTCRILELGYPRIYYRGSEEQAAKKESKKVGWWTTRKNKPALLGELGRAMDTGELQVNSDQIPKEAMGYVNMLGGKIEHIAAKTEDDPAGAGENHGDRVVGLALAWWMAKEYIRGRTTAVDTAVEVPENSFLYRRQKAQREKRSRDKWVPHSAKRSKGKF